MKAFMKINRFLLSFTTFRQNMKINSNHPCQCCLTERNYLSAEDLMFWVSPGSDGPQQHEETGMHIRTSYLGMLLVKIF